MFATFERFEIEMTLEQAMSASHQGSCDDDVAWLVRDGVGSKLDPEAVRDELREYGAWDDDELSDDEANLARIVWLAACNIREEQS